MNQLPVETLIEIKELFFEFIRLDHTVKFEHDCPGDVQIYECPVCIKMHKRLDEIIEKATYYKNLEWDINGLF